jgi:outer membrane protein OmpA-like peptidoglycan-associated protein/outer membrane protein W
VSLGAGASIFASSLMSRDPQLFDIYSPNNLKYKVDFAGEASVGYGFGNGLRVELQGAYLRNNVKSIGGRNPVTGTIDSVSGHGHGDVAGVFGNVLYDFDLTPMGIPALSPYVGVGLGYEQLHLNGVSSTDQFGETTNLSGTSGELAVQAIVGIAYNIDAVPGLALTAEYRFSAVPENLKFGGTFNDGAGTTTPVWTKSDGIYSHTGLLGIRYAFGQAPSAPPPVAAPPAPPPPPPAVTEARTYLVFFDWDRADLTSRAKQIVAEAAQASTHVATTRIEVNGYTDLSGTAAYNQRLSVRRAESVQAELVKDGVPQSEIGIHGYGETNPLVPTAKGVREPQNRRVEIILK